MSEPNAPGESAVAKVALRDQILTSRRRRGLASIGADARALAAVALSDPHVRRAATVAAYVSVGTEPGTGPLLDALVAAGKRVLLPILQPDNDLDWGVYDGSLVPARRGLLEPAGRGLGTEAIGSADVVLVPGVAVDHGGRRLGRGGGSYDRALARVVPGTWTAILVFDEEVVIHVPTDPHDRTVDAAITPTRVIQFG
ncbi:5-formyltetrahydrofolate cyclo-ligase [Nocardioides baekrokdamisoli]|uniref:5-formyltetrahydrofolate cyclo-ligase n=1 Tax=Nocardioides baekrokdamisoli TaxID=1804624 RepID=A0A3G9IEV8_9ACTN|nr:5-formyltetrahydrofolate cyclo-ligase [Nocardioides baekrokdamisoli]BBH16896.1 5-formyltetrahydrofolate cyclo-ligase [Nocardioides baekrokdamisoli]